MAERFGPYLLDGLLGRGGMGEVHRAFDTRKRGRLVALKRLPEQESTDEQVRVRFQREAEIAALLREPHVIPIHDYGEIDGRLYLDMRLVDGTDLARVLDRDGPLAPGRAVGLIEQVAAAHDAAHVEGLVHRDVKPSNILVTPGPPEFVYLVDFGIARAVDSTKITTAGTAVGTPAYMAPEQFDGKGDRRADVYSLACVLHQALTGREPFEADSLFGYLRAHHEAPPPRPSTVQADVPAGLDDIVARGMAKRPEDRYFTAGAFAAAARAALNAASDVSAELSNRRSGGGHVHRRGSRRSGCGQPERCGPAAERSGSTAIGGAGEGPAASSHDGEHWHRRPRGRRRRPLRHPTRRLDGQ